MKKTGCKQGFTLIELLVVVLIIGVLAAVALPQYQKAVEKTRAVQMLPIMRHIYEAYALYKLEHGSYVKPGNECPTWNELGIEPPTGFETSDWADFFWNDLWECHPNEEQTGYVYCENKKYHYYLWMVQPDDKDYSEHAGKRVCHSETDFGQKICKALGGIELEQPIWADPTFEF